MNNDTIVTTSEDKPQAPSALVMILLMMPLVLPLGLALDLYLPSLPTMANALNSTPIEIQLTLTIFMYCYGFGQLIAGPITDTVGRLPVLKVSLMLFTTGSCIATFSNSLYCLVFGRILQALGACGTQVGAFALVRDRYDGQKATLIYTSLKGAMAIAPICAPIAGAFLQINYGWQANFAVLGIYGFLVLLLCQFALKEQPLSITMSLSADKISRPKNLLLTLKVYHHILSHQSFLYFGICGLATQAAMFGYFSLSSQYFVKLHGLEEPDFAKLFSLNALVFLLTSLLIGKRIYKMGLSKTTLLGASLLLVSGILMLWGNFYFYHPYVLFLPNLIASSAAAVMLGAAASGAMLPFKKEAGRAAALFGSFEFIGGASIGQMAIWTDEITVLPLAILLICLSFLIGFSNLLLLKKTK